MLLVAAAVEYFAMCSSVVDQQSQPAAVDMNTRQPDSAELELLLLELAAAVELTIDYQLVSQDFEMLLAIVVEPVTVVVLAIVVAVPVAAAEPVVELPL